MVGEDGYTIPTTHQSCSLFVICEGAASWRRLASPFVSAFLNMASQSACDVAANAGAADRNRWTAQKQEEAFHGYRLKYCA
jgi:hypothetical protein